MLVTRTFRRHSLTFLPLCVCPKVWSIVCSLYLGVLSCLLYTLCCSGKKSLVFQSLHHSISEPNGSGSIFITGADKHHAMYNSMTVNPLSSSFTEKIHSSRDHLGLGETAVEVLFGSSSILGWMESFGLYCQFQSW